MVTVKFQVELQVDANFVTQQSIDELKEDIHHLLVDCDDMDQLTCDLGIMDIIVTEIP